MNSYPNWGATDSELTRAMTGDFLIAAPTYSTTLAVTVHASPEQIWPWLVQMGYRRGGLYSYDWLDRLFGFLDRPSADVILPEYQHLSVGDEIPMGRGPGFPVREIAPGRALVLGGKAGDFEWIWQFGLYPLDGGRTRIVSRNTARIPKTLSWRLFMWALKPAAFLMTRRMLIGLKRRAEHLAIQRHQQGPPLARIVRELREDVTSGYGRRIVVDLPYELALGATIHAIRDEGLSLIAQIDVREHFMRALRHDFRKYALLEVWSPELAFEVLRRDLQVGTIVPTTVVIYELADGETAVITRQTLVYGVTDRGYESEHSALIDAADRETERLARIFTRLEHVPRREAAPAAHAA